MLSNLQGLVDLAEGAKFIAGDLKLLIESVTVVKVSRSDAGGFDFWKKMLKGIPNEDSAYYYHVTFIDKLKEIRRLGLTPQKEINFPGFSSGQEVSLAPNIDDALYWGAIMFWGRYDDLKNRQTGEASVPVSVLLRVLKSKVIAPKQVRRDEVVTQEIKPALLQKWHKGRWVKL